LQSLICIIKLHFNTSIARIT